MFRSNIDGVAVQGRNGDMSAMYNFNILILYPMARRRRKFSEFRASSVTSWGVPNI
jgi:hypothetical protein